MSSRRDACFILIVLGFDRGCWWMRETSRKHYVILGPANQRTTDGATQDMYLPRIETLREHDRPALIHMLEDAGDLGPGTIGMYRTRRAIADAMLVAWVDGSLVGMLNVSYNADFYGMPDFEPFDLPRRPHAFMDRIHVHPAIRRRRVGQALVDAFTLRASDHACTFAGGHLDATSDPAGRIEFFERLGFEIHGHPPAFTAGMRL